MGYDPRLIMAQTRLALHRMPKGSRFRCGRAALGALCALGLLITASGCAYRVNIQQGNVVDQDSIEQISEGMTRSQVQFLLGTPMIADPFHADRWDYPYYFRQGRQREVSRRWFSVHFEDERVAALEHRIRPQVGGALPEIDPGDIDAEAIERELEREAAIRQREAAAREPVEP
jgi:outer membrane protein assembly factor BamE